MVSFGDTENSPLSYKDTYKDTYLKLFNYRLIKIGIVIGVGILLQGCNSPSDPTNITITQSPTFTSSPALTFTMTPVPTEVRVSTKAPQTQPPTAVNTETSVPTKTESISSNLQTGLVVDHNAVILFDQIPDEYLQTAGELLLFHRHASVGANIRMGLDCMANVFPERPYAPNITQIAKRPSWCDQGLESEEIIYDEKYDSSNWNFELHSQPNANPGWYNKANYFIGRMENLGPEENYNFASFNFGYVEDPSIINHFFLADNPDDRFPNVADLEALEDQFPETEFIWWTMALARWSEPHHEEFNQQLRNYTLTHGKILFDIADIESHLPDGTPCTGVDRNENPNDIEALCDIYTSEPVGGHLNALGSLRMAKAMWVLMAHLAGWDGGLN